MGFHGGSDKAVVSAVLGFAPLLHFGEFAFDLCSTFEPFRSLRSVGTSEFPLSFFAGLEFDGPVVSGVEDVEVAEGEVVPLAFDAFANFWVVVLFEDSDEIEFAVLSGELESCFGLFNVQGLSVLLFGFSLPPLKWRLGIELEAVGWFEP